MALLKIFSIEIKFKTDIKNSPNIKTAGNLVIQKSENLNIQGRISHVSN